MSWTKEMEIVDRTMELLERGGWIQGQYAKPGAGGGYCVQGASALAAGAQLFFSPAVSFGSHETPARVFIHWRTPMDRQLWLRIDALLAAQLRTRPNLWNDEEGRTVEEVLGELRRLRSKMEFLSQQPTEWDRSQMVRRVTGDTATLEALRALSKATGEAKAALDALPAGELADGAHDFELEVT